MNPTKPPDQTKFRAACAAIRNFPELRPYKEWLEQRRAAYVAELTRATDEPTFRALQGRVRELDDQLAEIGKTEDSSQ